MACADCGKSLVMMVPMQPGRDGKEWELCPTCHADGCKPMKLGRIKIVPIGDEKLFNALVAQSERLANHGSPVETDDPKATTADFDYQKRGRKRKAS